MLKRLKLYGLMLAVVLVAAACAPAAAPVATPEAMKGATPEAMMETTPETMMEATPDAMMSSTPDAMMNETPDAMVSQAMTDTMMAETPDAMASHPMTDTMMEATPDAMMPHDALTDTMMAETPDAMMSHDIMTDTMMSAPAWFSAKFTGATSGATFTVQDFKGKVVLVETMAIWCPTCLQQQDQIKALHGQLGRPADLVTLSIDVDINETLAGLKDYVAKNGFDWTYTVASTDVAREISNLYGAQFLNPPSTPMLIIDKHGEAHPLPFGLKSAADLQKALEPYLNDAM